MSTRRHRDGFDIDTLIQRNALLSALGDDVIARLRPVLEPVPLKIRTVLAEPGERLSHVYFVCSGIISRVGQTSEGRTLELACTGPEGAAGVLDVVGLHSSPYRLIVQLEGTALRTSMAEMVRLLDAEPTLIHSICSYASVVIAQLGQSAVCARYHTSRQRLARWLVTAADRAGVSTIPWSHEWITEMVGGTRSAVSTAASELRAEGAIAYTRRTVSIVDRTRLRDAACECAKVVDAAVREFVECHRMRAERSRRR